MSLFNLNNIINPPIYMYTLKNKNFDNKTILITFNFKILG